MGHILNKASGYQKRFYKEFFKKIVFSHQQSGLQVANFFLKITPENTLNKSEKAIDTLYV